MTDQEKELRNETLERLAAKAREGDREALESLVVALRADVYRIALRFLWHPEDAEDATQEILVKAVTGLATFRGESRLSTWVYRIACNTLLTLSKRRMEERAMTIDTFKDDLDSSLAATAGPYADPEHAFLLEEVKVGCTLAMLLCLDRPHRLAYILGDILELDHQEAALVAGIKPDTFRQRLSRSRQTITSLMASRCGIFDPRNRCRCRLKAGTAISLGRVDPQRLLFASSRDQARAFPAVVEKIRAIEETRRAAALYRSQGDIAPVEDFPAWLRAMIERIEA